MSKLILMWILWSVITVNGHDFFSHNESFIQQCITTICDANSDKTTTTKKDRRSLLIRRKHKSHSHSENWNYFLHKHEEDNGYDIQTAYTSAHGGPVADYNPVILESDSPSLLKVFGGVIKVKWPETHSYTYFKFKDYKKAFDDGKLSLKEKREMIRLREQTVFRIIEYSIQKTDDASFIFEPFKDIWYEKIGSDSLSSDFDFTYARWDKPRMVLPAMMSFYNREFQLYQGWPLSVWDLNMYVTSAFIKPKAYQFLQGNAKYDETRKLFTQIQWGAGVDEQIYALSHTYTGADAAKFMSTDKWLAQWFIVQKGTAIELGQLGIGENDFEVEMLKFSEIFYFIVYKLQTGMTLPNALTTNQVKLYLKTLLYFMNYYSDETYISGPALQYMRDNGLTSYDIDWRRIAILDNFAFVAEYYVHAMSDDKKNERQKWFYFFDRSFKYIVRIGDMIQMLLAHGSAIEQGLIQNDIGQRMADGAFNAIDQTTAQGTINAYDWYTLARLWMRKVDGKTIRGDIEKSGIIKANGNVQTKRIKAQGSERHQIELGRKIWTAILAKMAAPGFVPVWEKDTFFDATANTAPWTRLVKELQRNIDGVIAPLGPGVTGVILTEKVLSMMYNICGKVDFVAISGDPAAFQAVQGLLKGVVKAYKKYARKGQKLSISSSHAYNYKTRNPFEHNF